MTSDKSIESQDIDDLVRIYSDLLAEWGKPGSARSDRYGRRAAPYLAEIERRGPDALRKLRPLLQHSNERVRLAAAIHLAKVEPDESKDTIQRLARGGGPAASTAFVHLALTDEEFRKKEGLPDPHPPGFPKP